MEIYAFNLKIQISVNYVNLIKFNVVCYTN